MECDYKCIGCGATIDGYGVSRYCTPECLRESVTNAAIRDAEDGVLAELLLVAHRLCNVKCNSIDNAIAFIKRNS